MRIVPRFVRLFADPADPGLPPPTPTPTPAPAPEPRSGRLTCEGCGCSLDSKGQIVTRGEGLRAFMAREDDVTRLEKEIAQKDEQIAQLSARVREIEEKPTRKSVLW